MNRTRKLVPDARQPPDQASRPRSFSWYSRSCSAPVAPALRAPRTITTAPAASNAAATSRTGWVGSSETRLPAATASTHWTANAAATPSQTGHGRYRVASTRVATKVLSGNPTAATSANAVPAETSHSTVIECGRTGGPYRHPYPGRPTRIVVRSR